MKKMLSMTLALLLVFSLAACGGSSSSTSTPAATEAPATAAPATQAPETAAPATEAPASGSDLTPRQELPSTSSDLVVLDTVEIGYLHMSTNAAFPPYEMLTDDGGFEGIDVEVAGKIAERMGLELVVDDMDFDAALLAAQNGQSDIVMAGVTVTDERQEVMDFSDSYATAIQVIIVKDDSPIATVDDLANASMIGTQRATTGYIYCSDDYGEDHVTAFSNGATAVQALLNGQVDAVVIDNMPAQEFVKANPGLKILDTAYAEEQYAIGMQKGHEKLLTAINIVLAELRADGTLQAIVDKYITAE